MPWDHVFDPEYEEQYDPHPEGDPRRCPVHPGVRTSSADGLHDGPCRLCEYESEMTSDEEEVPDDGLAPFAPIEAILHLRPASWHERRTDPFPCF